MSQITEAHQTYLEYKLFKGYRYRIINHKYSPFWVGNMYSIGETNHSANKREDDFNSSWNNRIDLESLDKQRL